MRNHGDSPHADEMTIEVMSEDVIRFMDENNIEEANILGHSLGGRVLMETTVNHPERVKNQIVMDIGPFDYYDEDNFPHTNSTFKILRGLNLIKLKGQTRKSLREQIHAVTKEDTSLRDFFMASLHNIEGSKTDFYWSMNLPIIYRSYQDMLCHTPTNKKCDWNGKMKVFAARNAGYVKEDLLHEFQWYFKDFDIKADTVWFDTGHWIHYENPVEFLTQFDKFNKELE